MTKMSLKRKQPLEPHCSGRQSHGLSIRELIPPKRFAPAGYTLSLSNDNTSHGGSNELVRHDGSCKIILQLDWTAVIARARSHPREAGDSYFIHSTNNSNSEGATSGAEDNSTSDDKILTYKPLHAMLKYDPPLPAVEAVLRAHPFAALDVTFEGTALKIAAESKVSSMPVLRLLLVAEMAMRLKLKMLDREKQQQLKNKEQFDPQINLFLSPNEADEKSSIVAGHELSNVSEDGFDESSIPSPLSPSRMFNGHNPIRWIAEPHIPRKTAAALLRWYPVGAFQRPRDDDGAPVDQIHHDYYDEDAMYADSPLIEIVDDFASDQDAVGEQDDNDDNNEDSESDDDLDVSSDPGSNILPRRRRTSSEREYLRKERRWEKFLHILYATDKMMMSTRSTPSSILTEVESDTVAISRPDSSPTTRISKQSNDIYSEESDQTSTAKFHPVHAFIRCITNSKLGFEICRAYGAWSILRAMGQRIPLEFTAKDESDGNRTAFQTLAENPAAGCRLCSEEIRDIVEFLIDADYRSVYSPRKSDGRLIAHVALENGWPCGEFFSRKSSATSA